MSQTKWFIWAIAGIMVNISAVKGQQDPFFSQYMFNGLFINPAYSGYQPKIQAAAFHKKYGVPFQSGASSSLFSINAPLRYNQIGIGALLVNDQYSFLTRNDIKASMAYKINIFKGTMAFGMNIGLTQFRFDPELLKIKDIDDYKINEDRINKITPDLGAGLFYQHRIFYLGVSGMHLFNRTFSQNNVPLILPIHLYVNGGLQLKLSNEWKLVPSFLLRYITNRTYTLDVTVHTFYSDLLWFGISAREPSLLSAQTGVKLSNLIKTGGTTEVKVGYAFDYVLGNRRYIAPSMQEIFLLIDFQTGNSTKTIKKQKIKVSPLFF